MLAFLKLWMERLTMTPVPNFDETKTESNDEEEDDADDGESNPIIDYKVL